MRITLRRVAVGLVVTVVLAAAAPAFDFDGAERADALGPYLVNVEYDAPDSNPGDGTCDDGTGSCTLRAAVTEANNDGTATINLTLATPANYFINTGEIVVTGASVTITNTGVTTSAQADVNASNANRGFVVMPGATLNLNRLRVVQGTAPAGDGGCINNHGTLNLSDVLFLDCRALTGGRGGAVFNDGTLDFESLRADGFHDSRFTRNYAAQGGGLYNTGTASMSGVMVDLNEAQEGGNGAGIYNDGGTIDLTASSINSAYFGDNVADGNGGGIYNEAGVGSIDLTGGRMSTNLAGGDGAAIWNDATLSVLSSVITTNTATGNGGGFYNGAGGTGDIATSTVSENAAVDGAGLYTTTSLLSINTSGITKNNASRDGGGIWSGGSGLSVTNSTVGGNTAARHGGGIYQSGPSAPLVATTVYDNAATISGNQLWLQSPAGALRASNSIIAASTNPPDSGTPYDCDGGGTLELPTTSTVFLDDDSQCQFTGIGTTAGAPQNQTAPSLSSLNNGGPDGTPGYLPNNDVPGADVGVCAAYAEDQWDVTRPSVCDNGALEVTPSAPPTDDGSIAGTVTRADTGAGLSNICVEAENMSGPGSSDALTGSDGTYVIDDLPDGSYKVHFTDCHSPTVSWIGEYYDDQRFEDDAALVTVSGAPTVGIDAELAAGGTINGRVTDEDTHLPIEGITVALVAFDPTNDRYLPVQLVRTDADGRYEFDGVGVGTWYVGFVDQDGAANGGPYTYEWFDNVLLHLGPSPDPVADGAFPFIVSETTGKGRAPIVDFHGVADAELGTGTPTGPTVADVWIEKTASTATVTAGTQFQYTFTTGNHGVVTATDVTVTDVLPAGLTYVSGDDGCTYAAETRTVTCAVGALATDATATTAITVTAAAGAVSNVATVDSQQTDPVLTNNTSSAEVQATGAATDPPAASTPTSTADLARTGLSSTPAQVAFALLALGALFVLVGRRPSRRSCPDRSGPTAQ